ncbi:histidine kinase [Pontibacter sp. G13]|uniref:sensor histidine kinase n=1 Tax=Pontibacter sp. G13 TaxID=3074898 RepID=UPI00288AE781|nr:histidine kinase [Pontibacter sp. G13]WNJ20438.1 histidine kinase [Pontibacter sp. G13]
MPITYNRFSRTQAEWIFQVILHLIVFFAYSLERNRALFDEEKIVYFLTYAAAAWVIDYVLLPRFFYKGRYWAFFLWTVAVITGVIVIEELGLEQVYFPDTKGQKFPGVIYTLVDVMPVIVILSGCKFAWDALVKQQQLEELKVAIEESELQFLKSQINPHFLFNNLNNLYSYAIEDSPKTPQIILELSSVLRYMLYDCREEYVPVAKEIRHLKNFTKLNELQIEERGTVNLRVGDIPGNFQIAPLILIVFVENAFKHSQASQSDNIFIDMDLRISPEGKLYFTCINNYFPVANTDNLSKGIGMQNVRKRLQLLYPNAHELEIRDQDSRFEVRLAITLSSIPST